MSSLRARLTYANVMATIAVFIALGGSSYAALKLPKNSVGSKQIKRNAVTSTKVKNGSLLQGDFKRGQLNFLTPGAADAKFLPKGAQAASAATAGSAANATNAGNAAKLGGAPAADFAKGQIFTATMHHFAFPPPTGSSLQERTIPGWGTLKFECTGASHRIFFVTRPGETVQIASLDGSPPSDLTDVDEYTLAQPSAGNNGGDQQTHGFDVTLAGAGRALTLSGWAQQVRGGSPLHATCSAAVTAYGSR